ncbi:MAG: tyrosine-type recombinase/integrase [Rhodocyclaceae bacterium]|nr:tyrosine-type recombinase/integrase [Rhodocyclaceae bacterium]
MAKLEDVTIKRWIKEGEHFEQRCDGEGLYLSFRKTFKSPVWLFRYRFKGKQRPPVNIGSYTSVGLAAARKAAKLLSAQVTMGYDVGYEKQKRKREADDRARALTVSALADEYFTREVVTAWKNPAGERGRIDNYIKPAIGHMKAAEVTTTDIDMMIHKIVKSGTLTTANKVLAISKRMFNFGLKRQIITTNPAAVFTTKDAGGDAESRDRFLTADEITLLFKTLHDPAHAVTTENIYAIRLLLLLGVRKEELTAAKWEEFNLVDGIWYLEEGRTKTSAAIDIPIPQWGLDTLAELKIMAGANPYLFPARRLGTKLPHISDATINATVNKMLAHMPTVPHFTVHDLRRTTRTHLGALHTPPHVAEKCINHKQPGMAGVYDRHDYFDERKTALNDWARLLQALETGDHGYNVIPLKAA